MPRWLLVALGLVAAVAGAWFAWTRSDYYRDYYREQSNRENDATAVCVLHALLRAAGEFQKLCLRDEDSDGVGEYPRNLSELSNASPLKEKLGFIREDCVYRGYVFEVRADSKTPEKRAYISARPRTLDTGRQSYVVATDSTIFFSPTAADPTYDWYAEGPGEDFVTYDD